MKPVDLDDVERRRDCWDSGDAHAGGRLLSEDMPAILAECPCDDCKRAEEVLG